MQNFLISLFVFFPVLSLAGAEPIIVVQKLSPGRQLQVQISLPEPGRPTFLLLPGVNRAPFLKEPVAQKLIQHGNGVVAFNFSVQPLSVATLAKAERPDFYNSEVNLETLARETEAVAKFVTRDYGIRKLIPVSISYSGAVSFHLRGFSEIIDSVPLSSMDAYSPELALYRNWLKAGELLNPFFGPAITRASLDNAYRFQWETQVTGMATQFDLPAYRHSEMVDGYIRLSRAAEGFEWKNSQDSVLRIFILAEKDSRELLRHQLETVRDRLAKGRRESLFLVRDSGHVIPAEEPAVYAQILELVANGENQPGLTLVSSHGKEWSSYSIEESIRLLDQAKEGLPTGRGGKSEIPPKGEAFPGKL